MADLSEVNINVRVTGKDAAISGLESIDNSLVRNMKRIDTLTKQYDYLDRQLNKHKISLTEYAAGIQSVDAAIETAQRNIYKLENGLASGTYQLQQSGKAARHFQLGIQQAGYQVGDFFVQVASGTNPMVAFTQQATQLAGFFAGPWGAAIGAALSIVGAIGVAWMHVAEANDKATESAKVYEDLLKRIADANKASKEEALGVSLSLDDQSLITAEYEKRALIEQRNLLAAQQLNAENSKRIELNNQIVALNDQITNLVSQQAARKEALRMVEEASLGTKQREAEQENQLLVARAKYGDKSVQVAAMERAQYAAQLSIKQQQLGLSEEHVRKEMEIYDKTAAAKKEAEDLKVATENGTKAAQIGVDVWEALKNKVADAAAQAREYASATAAGASLRTLPDERGSQRGARRSAAEFNTSRILERLGLNSDGTPKKTRKSGGGGGKGPSEDTIEKRLQALYEYLGEVDKYQIEAENIAYSRREDTLKAALEKKLITLQEYNELEKELARQHEEDLKALRSEADAQSIQAQQNLFKVYEDLANASSGAQLGAWGNFFGSMANLAQSGNERILKIQKAFVAAQALMDAWGAYNKVLNSPGLPWWARIPAAANILAAGLGAVSAIKGISASGGTTSASSATSTVSSTTTESSPQTVYLSGLDPNAFYSGEQLQNLFDAFYDENDKRGKVFVVART